MALPAAADELRVAFWNADLSRSGPALFLRDALTGRADDISAAQAAIDALDADIIVLGGMDYDATGAALAAFNAGLARPYAFALALPTLAGVGSGFDLDGNGKMGEARDALAYGRFRGEGGMAVLSRLAIAADQSRDFTGFLWADLPDARLPPMPQGAALILPLSSSGHHDTAVSLPDGRMLHLLSWHGTTPAFDGAEDRNGKRNYDETAFWLALLDHRLPFAPPEPPFILLGQANADPDKGDGDAGAIKALLADARLQSPLSGDTSDYGGDLGPLRVAYILPSADLRITASGMEPAPKGARHKLLWVDLQTQP